MAYAVFACSLSKPEEVYDVFDTWEEAEACAVELNGKDDDYDYRVASIAPNEEYADVMSRQRIEFTDDELDTMCSLHYYGWEHPGKTWDGIPPGLVQQGLDGLAAFLRIAQWSKTGKDPLSVNSEIPF